MGSHEVQQMQNRDVSHDENAALNRAVLSCRTDMKICMCVAFRKQFLRYVDMQDTPCLVCLRKLS